MRLAPALLLLAACRGAPIRPAEPPCVAVTVRVPQDCDPSDPESCARLSLRVPLSSQCAGAAVTCGSPQRVCAGVGMP